jgi:hypothetical protein
MGKFSTIRKVKRQIRELKYTFPDQNLITIKEESVPLIMSKIANSLIRDGTDGIDDVINLLIEYKISNDVFKENIIDLAATSIVSRYEKLSSSIKGALTRKLNERSKTSIKRTKQKTVVIEGGNVRYDEEGNVREEREEPEEDEQSEDIKSIKTKKKSTKNKK